MTLTTPCTSQPETAQIRIAATPVAARPSFDLGGAALQSAMSSSQEASILLQLYTQTILGTPDIELPAGVDKLSGSTVVEDLPKHQKSARTNANDYLKSVNPTLIAEVADIIGFANLWNAEFASLLGFAKNIDQPGNKANFTTGIQNLINQVKAKQADVAPALSALNGFLPRVQRDLALLADDAADVERALGGTGGEIARLKASISADQSERGKYIGIIVGGATTDVVGAVMILVGVFAEIETAGLSTALVAGGAAVVAGGTTAMISAGTELGVLDARISSESQKLAADELLFASTNQAHHNVDALETATQRGVAAVTSLQKSWLALDHALNGVLQELSVAGPDLGSWLENLLLSANDDWATALKLARSIQQYGVLPVKKTKH